MITYRVNVSGVAEAVRYFQQLSDRLNKRDNGLIRATNEVAKVWQQNFDEEGSAVGGWDALAEKTLAMREYYGFESGPVLIRYGALKAVVTDKFATAQVAGQWSMADTYSSQVTEGSLALTSDGRAILSAHGWKVSNQYGFSSSRGDVPARPFWFTNDNVQSAARDGVVLWLVDEVI